jgi:sugar/nucleoside kinase (ribokinase family)
MVQRHRATLEQAQVVCVVGMFDLAGFGVPGAADVLSWARKNGKTTLLDTGGDPDGWPPTTVRAIEALLGDVSYLVINSFEAAGISGEDDPWQACAALRARTGGSVIVKCGADGSYGLDATGRHRVPAAAVTPADAVGAGDSYDAGLLSGLVRGLPFDECMSVATAVATIYVGRRENRYPSPAEVSAFLAAHALSGTAPDIAGGEKPTTAKQEDSHT